MEQKIESTGLIQLQSGAAVEMTDDALKEVFANILDLNTDATSKRSVTLTIDLVPDPDRESAKITIGVKKVLAPQSKQTTKLYLGKLPDGTAIAVEHNPRQPSLFDGPAKAEASASEGSAGEEPDTSAEGTGNVVSMKKRAANP